MGLNLNTRALGRAPGGLARAGQRWRALAPPSSARLPRRRAALVNFRPRALAGGAAAPPAAAFLLLDIDLAALAPALNITQDMAVVVSALFALVSVGVNLWGGIVTEQKRAELQLELERDKAAQRQVLEVQSVVARYRGPVLEAAIDLERKLWHLVLDKWLDPSEVEPPGDAEQGERPRELRYTLFVMAQFLGYLEVVRREGPREAHFLQVGSPAGTDTLSTLVEGIRFVLSASPAYLELWHSEGLERHHPGARRRPPREELVERLRQRQQEQQRGEGGEVSDGRPVEEPQQEGDLLRITRGQQRAIGALMIMTPMGAERHYTMGYGDFHSKLDSDARFQEWFAPLESDLKELAGGRAWAGEAAFPIGRWTRILLLQQLLVELMDLLDPDCVRLPLGMRVQLGPVAWAGLPGLEEYRGALQELNLASDFGRQVSSALEGLGQIAGGRPADRETVGASSSVGQAGASGNGVRQ